LPRPGWFGELQRHQELTDCEHERRCEREAKVDQTQTTAHDDADGAGEEAPTGHPRLSVGVLVVPAERLERVEVKGDVGSGQRSETDREQHLAGSDDGESVVADQPAGEGADPGHADEAEREHAAETVAGPAGGYLARHNRQVVDARELDGAIQVETCPGEQHEDGQPRRRPHEQLVPRDEPEVPFEPGAFRRVHHRLRHHLGLVQGCDRPGGEWARSP